MLQITSFLFLISNFDEKNSSKNKAEWAGQAHLAESCPFLGVKVFRP